MKTLMVYSRPSIQSTLKKSNLKRVPNQILLKQNYSCKQKIGNVGQPLSMYFKAKPAHELPENKQDENGCSI